MRERVWWAPSARPTWSRWRSRTSCQCPHTSRPTPPCTAIQRHSVSSRGHAGSRCAAPGIQRDALGIHTQAQSLSLFLPRVAAEMGDCSRPTSRCTAPRIRGHAGIQCAALGGWGLYSGFSVGPLKRTCQGWCCYCTRGVRSVGGSRQSHLAQHARAQRSQAGGAEEPPDPMTPRRARRKWSLLGRGKAPLPCCLAPAPRSLRGWRSANSQR